ncbi:MAG: hypothetical protein JWP94_639 [Mucilaginibacter sp.]|nr:hypothetical protein [Mucilaginibacter sp.]
MAKKIKLGTILPNDTFFYSISFDQPCQKVTREALKTHFPEPRGYRAYMGIHTEYKGFTNGLVVVQVKLPESTEHMLYLHVGLAELDIACTCGMPDGKLCRHAYMGLHSMAWHQYLDLERFYWPGFTNDEKIKVKFLDTEVSKGWIAVKPKAKYGNIFKSTIGFVGDKQLSIRERSKLQNIISGGQEVIGYCLAYNIGNYGNSLLPALVPCLGLTSKNNKNIVSFKQFGRADKPIHNINYTANQQLLNDIGYKQYGIAKTYDNLGGEEKRNEGAKLKQQVLNLWEQAIPLLLNEKYNYIYYLYWLKYLKDKPRKTEMQNCRYSLDRPVLSFTLKFHQDHFSLTAVVFVDGNPLKFNHKPHLFVFDEVTELCYLMPSVQDDDLLIWIFSHNNRLTILKEHFIEFHQSLLENLSRSYEVFYDNKAGKKIKYELKTVLFDSGIKNIFG